MCHSRVSSIRGPGAAQIPFPLGPFGTGGLWTARGEAIYFFRLI